MGVDVSPARAHLLALVPKAACDHVYGSVAVGHRLSPHERVQVGPGDHVASLRKRKQQLELAAGQIDGASTAKARSPLGRISRCGHRSGAVRAPVAPTLVAISTTPR
jgi:hypothetical protein